MYLRNQSSGAKQWILTDFYLCDCGEVIKIGFKEVEVMVINSSLAEKIRDALNVEVKDGS